MWRSPKRRRNASRRAVSSARESLIVQEVVCALLIAYIIILFGRMIMSWLPPTSGGMATVSRMLFDLTEPVLAPMRRMIPPTGMIDLSFTILTFGLFLIWRSVC